MFWGDGLFDLPEDVDHEVSDFHRATCTLRADCRATDPSNTGHLCARVVHPWAVPGRLVALVYVAQTLGMGVGSVSLECDLAATGAGLMTQVVTALRDREEEVTATPEDLVLKLYGRADFFDDPKAPLGQYHECHRALALGIPVVFSVHKQADIPRPFKQTTEDDARETDPLTRAVRITDSTAPSVAAKGLLVLLDTYRKEAAAFDSPQVS